METVERLKKTQEGRKRKEKMDEWRSKCSEGDRKIEQITTEFEQLEKKQDGLAKQQNNMSMVLWRLQEEKGKDKTLVVKALHKYVTQADKVLQLPREFWVFRSPCTGCSEILIQAYAHLPEDIPTIHIGAIHDKDNIRRLQDHFFKFELWDIQRVRKHPLKVQIATVRVL